MAHFDKENGIVLSDEDKKTFKETAWVVNGGKRTWASSIMKSILGDLFNQDDFNRLQSKKEF